MPEETLSDDKCENGYRSDVEVEVGMSRATHEAKERERASTEASHASYEPRHFVQFPSRNVQ